MALSFGNEQDQLLFRFLKDKRELHYIVSRLFGSTPGSSLAQIDVQQAIKAFQNLLPVNKNNILNEKNDYLLPLEEFNWLQKDTRACNFVWFYIKNIKINIRIESIPFFQSFNYCDENNFNCTPSFYYCSFGLPCSTAEKSERFESIIDFFDFHMTSLSGKRKAMALLKNEWQNVFNSKKPFNWLNIDDEDQCHWAYEYCQKYSQVNSLYPLPNIFNEITPINSEEKYYAVFAFYDLNFINYSIPLEQSIIQRVPPHKPSAEQKLFRQNIDKAWYQKKFRQDKASKAPLNTYLDIETKNKLNKLTLHHNRNIHDLIDSLITQEYERTFKK